MNFEIFLFFVTFLSGILYFFNFFNFKLFSDKNIFSYYYKMTFDFIKSFFPFLFFILIFRTFFFEPFRIPSSSMRPTLLEGDFILVNKFSYGIKVPFFNFVPYLFKNPKYSDVIVFKRNNFNYVKRVVGLPGDHIIYDDNVLYVNGNRISKIYINKLFEFDLNENFLNFFVYKECYLLNNFYFVYNYSFNVFNDYLFNDIIVPDGSFFVLGDNRDNSDDSRYWGFVKQKNLVGKAFFIWMSWDYVYKEIRFERVGKYII